MNPEKASDTLVKHFIASTNLFNSIDKRLSVHGISFKEYLIMRNISQAPNNVLRRVELAELVGVTASGITRLLAPMEKIGLIEKRANARDARVSLVTLSEAGTRLLIDADASFEQCATDATDSLTDRQLQTFSQLFDKIAL